MLQITLLSDFGLRDASAAIAKGILMQLLPGANITDITHEITPFRIRQAAYMLGGAYSSFPEGTIHLALFDIYSEVTPTLILVAHNNHYFLAADNGLLPMALESYELTAFKCFQPQKDQTLHDWVAAAGRIATQLEHVSAEQLGWLPIVPKSIQRLPDAPDNSIECDIIHIDKYENVVINFTRKQYDSLPKERFASIQFIQFEEITRISNNYSDVKEGYKLCRFNNNGYLEIAINKGKAASLFGLKLDSENNKIKIKLQ